MTDATTTTDATGTEESAQVPVITVTRGNPTPEEIAAVTVLLAAAGGSDDGADRTVRRGWSRPGRRLTGSVSPAMGWGRL